MPLSNKQIFKIADSTECNPDDRGWGPKFSKLEFARAIESAATEPLLAQIAQLEAQLAEARKDAERYNWIAGKVHERPLRPAAYGNEMLHDMRLRYELPVLVSYDAIGQQISFDAAIDAAIAQEQQNTTAETRQTAQKGNQ